MSTKEELFTDYQNSQSDMLLATDARIYCENKVEEARKLRDAEDPDKNLYMWVYYDMIMNMLYYGDVVSYTKKSKIKKLSEVAAQMLNECISKGWLPADSNLNVDSDANAIKTVLAKWTGMNWGPAGATSFAGRKLHMRYQGVDIDAMPILSAKGWRQMQATIKTASESIKKAYDEAIKAERDNINIASQQARVDQVVELSQTQQAIQNTHNVRTVMFVILVGAAIFVALKIFKIL